jgi:hypothetical protein
VSPARRCLRESTTATVLAAAVVVASCGGSAGVGSGAGSPDAGGSPSEAGGSPSEAGGFDATDARFDAADDRFDAADAGFDAADAGFAVNFTARARADLAAGAPPWTCATALPNVPVTDTASMRDAVRQFIARIVGVPPADIMMTVSPYCGAAMPGTSCASTYSHDVSKSGGAIYDTVAPLARELDANATAVEETIWVPMQNGMSLQSDVVMSGISDGTLVGMVVFNSAYACH